MTAAGPSRLRTTSRLAMRLAKILPRGYWRLIKWVADRDPAMWDVALPLYTPTDESIRVDLRETVSINFLRHGLIPGQRGHEALLRGLLRPGDTCFDVGANVGYTAILFASLVQPGGRVVALEPGDRAYRILERNAQGRPYLDALKLGASNEVGTLTFYESEMSDVSSLIPVDQAKELTIETTTLDALARQHGVPQFVKIDVEGHEPEVFAGMADLLRGDRAPAILFEALTAEVLARCIATIERTGADMKVQAIAKDGSLSSRLDLRETADFLALPRWAEERLPEVFVSEAS